MKTTSAARCALLTAALLATAAPASAAPARYVALGSSFAAGPGVSKPADEKPDGCGRSIDNYSHQLARKRGLALTDVSCSGATTASILQPWRDHPAQIDAVTPDAALVTITIGGNDVGYSAGLAAASCRQMAGADAAALAKCPAQSRPTEEAFAALTAAMKQIAAEVRTRAPRARVAFVDYLTVLPATGGCAVTPLAPADADALRKTVARVSEITARTARENGAVLLAASSLSKGHDACGQTPWVAGFPVPAGTAAYHPNLAGMTAVAEALDRALPR